MSVFSLAIAVQAIRLICGQGDWCFRIVWFDWSNRVL